MLALVRYFQFRWTHFLTRVSTDNCQWLLVGENSALDVIQGFSHAYFLAGEKLAFIALFETAALQPGVHVPPIRFHEDLG